MRGVYTPYRQRVWTFNFEHPYPLFFVSVASKGLALHQNWRDLVCTKIVH
jgi:hypothetical protein